MWVLCEDKKLYFTDRFFAEFPKLGGIAVINRTLRPADLSLCPIFSVAVDTWNLEVALRAFACQNPNGQSQDDSNVR